MSLFNVIIYSELIRVWSKLITYNLTDNIRYKVFLNPKIQKYFLIILDSRFSIKKITPERERSNERELEEERREERRETYLALTLLLPIIFYTTSIFLLQWLTSSFSFLSSLSLSFSISLFSVLLSFIISVHCLA